MREVRAAKNTAIKKITIRICPNAKHLKISGIVMNIRGGPELISLPKANTAGIIRMAAIIEASVSKNTIFFAEETISSLFFE